LVLYFIIGKVSCIRFLEKKEVDFFFHLIYLVPFFFKKKLISIYMDAHKHKRKCSISSAELVSEVSKGLFCEYFVNSAIKWKVCPQEFSDLVHEYENAPLLEYNATLEKKKSVTSRGVFYQDLLGRLTMEEKEEKFGQRTNTTNGLPTGKDGHKEESTQRPTSSLDHNATQDGMSNKTNDVSASSELLHNFPIFNSRRGFGKAQSPLLRGGGKKNRVNTQTKPKVEYSFHCNLNISRHDLLRGRDEDTYDGTVLKRIISRGMSKVCIKNITSIETLLFT
jgi:hypothetical protein